MSNLINRKKESSLKNDCNFIEAANEFGNVAALPLNRYGLRYLRIMSAPDYKEKLSFLKGKGLKEIENILKISNPPDLTRIPFIDRNGNGIHLGERKNHA